MGLFPNKDESNHLKILLAVGGILKRCNLVILRNITNRMKGAINYKHYTVS